MYFKYSICNDLCANLAKADAIMGDFVYIILTIVVVLVQGQISNEQTRSQQVLDEKEFVLETLLTTKYNVTDLEEGIKILGNFSSESSMTDLALAVAFVADNGYSILSPQNFAQALTIALSTNPKITALDFGKTLIIARNDEQNFYNYTMVDYAEAIFIAGNAGLVLGPQELVISSIHDVRFEDISRYSPQEYAKSLAKVAGLSQRVSISDLARAVAYASEHGDIHDISPMDYAEAIVTAAPMTRIQLTALAFAQATTYSAQQTDGRIITPLQIAQGIVAGSSANPLLTPLDFAEAVAYSEGSLSYLPIDYGQAMFQASSLVPNHTALPDIPQFQVFDLSDAYEALIQELAPSSNTLIGVNRRRKISVGGFLHPQTFAESVAYAAKYGHHYNFPPQQFGKALKIAFQAGEKLTAQDFAIAIAMAAQNNFQMQNQSPIDYANAVRIIALAKKSVKPRELSKAILVAAARGNISLAPQDLGEGLQIALNAGYAYNVSVMDLAIATDISSFQGQVVLTPKDFGEFLAIIPGYKLDFNPIEVAKLISKIALNEDINLSPQEIGNFVVEQIPKGDFTSFEEVVEILVENKKT